MIIHVGLPETEELPGRVWEQWLAMDPTAMPAKASTNFHRFWIRTPSLWGASLLDRVAASLALGRGLPPPFDEECEPDPDRLSEEYLFGVENEELEPRFRGLLHDGYEGLYLPHSRSHYGYSAEGGSGIGFCAELADDVSKILEVLEAGQPVVLTLADLWAKASSGNGKGCGYSREVFIARALINASQFAMESGAPLYLSWEYELKPVDQPLSVRTLSYHGFSGLKSASLTSNREGLEVTLDGGYRYRIPLEYLGHWGGYYSGSEVREVAVDEYRSAVDMKFASGQSQVSLVTILEWCEPSFECFGGWEEILGFQEIYERFAPLRVFPRAGS